MSVNNQLFIIADRVFVLSNDFCARNNRQKSCLLCKYYFVALIFFLSTHFSCFTQSHADQVELPSGTPIILSDINLPGFAENQPTVFDSIPSYRPIMNDIPVLRLGVIGENIASSGVRGAAGDFSVKADQFRKMSTDGYVADTSGTSQILYSTQIVKAPITVLGTRGIQTTIDGEAVYIIEDGCRIQQGQDRLEASRAVLWEKPHPVAGSSTVRRLTVYLESERGEPMPIIDLIDGSAGGVAGDRYWMGNLATSSEINIMISERVPEISRLPDVFHRAALTRHPAAITSRPFQHLSDSSSTLASGAGTGITGFYYNAASMQWLHFPEVNQSKLIIERGVNIVISGLQSNELMAGDTIDMTADRAVGWTVCLQDRMQTMGGAVNVADLDMELYLEGNIIFREGDRVIYADRMYYDVKNAVGKILGAEIYTPVPQYDGVIRIKADSAQRTGPGSFSIQKGLMTTSMMGEPSFYVRSRNIRVEQKHNPIYNDTRRFVVAEHNVVNMGLPVFYWPWLAFDAKEPVMFLKRAEYYHDNIFGHQARTRWDLYQMLNIRNRPEGTALDLHVVYLTKRGLGHGVQFTYKRDSFLGAPTPAVGLADYWGIYDRGHDNLGLARRDLTPETDYRYRAFWQHKQYFNNEPFGKWFGNGWLLSAELGVSSDRNFLPQYFGREWETFKDETTALELKRTQGSQSLAFRADYTIENFYDRRSSLPRFDHHTLGFSPLDKYFGDRFTWYEHTHIGLRGFETLTSPQDPADAAMFRYLDWEVAPGSTLDPNDPFRRVDSLKAMREVLSTRHEIDMPFNLGPIKCVPYLAGEYAHWGKDRNDDSADRLMGTVGFRANLPFWKVNPNYSSRTLYINGVAHKVNVGFDLSLTEVNKGYNDLIPYDSIDDRSIEDFRRRYSTTTFHGAIPLLYDERYYAIRSGMGNWITSPGTELADDLMLCRLHFNQTWQTKRGPTNRRRIIDWITLDTGLNLYPKKEQNFDETIGLIDYNFRWHVGDRFTVLSSGLFDTFNSGQTIVRFGGMMQRPGRGNIYLGADRLEGPFHRTYLNGSVAYNLSEKWATNYSTSYDLNEGRFMGQNITLFRKGEVFVVKLGANYDWSRNVWGISFGLEPAFLSKLRGGQSFNTL